MTHKTKLTSLIAAAAMALTVSAPAFAQDAEVGEVLASASGPFSLQLNDATNQGTSCRMTQVAKNDTGLDLNATAFEMVIFNTEQKVSQMLILEFGDMANGRTRVVQFDIENQPCEDISQILVNDQVQCETDTGSSDACLARLETEVLNSEIQFNS